MKKNIFQKKNRFNFVKIFFIFFLFIFLISFIFYKKNNELDFFYINEFTEPFYIIPEDKEGIKVANLEKKSLHQNYNNLDIISVTNDPLLNYSIQLFASPFYEKVIDKYLFYENNIDKFDINYKENIDNIYIFILNINSNPEYFLLYQNFESGDLAFDYCKKYLTLLERCVVVNAKNIN